MNFHKFLALSIVPLFFLIIQITTIYDYGINWDNPLHFNRGQAYLNYFLTGEKNYLKLPKYPPLTGASDYRDIRGNDSILFVNSKPSRIEASQSAYKKSYYQSDVFNFEYFQASDSGHPPVNGILSAITNDIFYQKLGILDDVAGYQIAIIISSFLLVLAVSIFVFLNFGFTASVVSVIFLSFYPLFFAESQFNIKDPVEASFFGLTIISFYFGATKRSPSLILAAAIFGGLAVGTKFNALFIPFVLIPWFGHYIYRNKKVGYFLKGKTKAIDYKIIIVLLLSPLIALSLLYITWPYLWTNPLQNLLNVLIYYKEIGTGVSDSLKPFLFYGWNTYPLIWLIFTTPVPVLAFCILGIAVSLRRLYRKETGAEKNSIYALVLLWFLVPLLRVSIPGSNIYGGVRQIMEIVPAIAVLSGIGASYLVNMPIQKSKTVRFMLIFLVLASMVFVIGENLSIHPNENVYFNQIAGGLSGAKRMNIPSWGSSFGNTYMQGVAWLNDNAPANAKLGLPIGNMVNIPRTRLRKDIDFSNDNFSGFTMEGEYEIELAHDYSPKEWFSYQYLERFLVPVYQVNVQGVPILKIWKNDLAHAKTGYGRERSLRVDKYHYKDGKMLIELAKPLNLTRLYISNQEAGCKPKFDGSLSLSLNGKNFRQEPETLAYPQMSANKLGINPDKTFFFLFPGKEARFILITGVDNVSCLADGSEVTVFYLDNLGDIAVGK